MNCWLHRLGALLVLASGCASVQRVPLRSEVVRLPDGRFIGPLEIAVPRRADHDGHDFEIHVTLRTRCGPLLTLAFPDGETRPLGDGELAWQDLLLRRARYQTQPAATQEGLAPAPGPPVPLSPAPTSPQPSPPQPAPLRASAPGATATVDAQLAIPLPAPPSGHWEQTATESWPGQLAFERERARRCGRSTEYRAHYLNAFDESGTLALWADVPQELLEAELRYEIIELVPTRKPPPVVEAAPVASSTEARPAKPRPPPPEPKKENPDRPEEPRATWQPGEWVWAAGDGEWVWTAGHWLAPATAPPPQAELTGALPNPGCTWVAGFWTWEQRAGRWVWQRGRWSAPPPLAEDRGVSPGEGAPWNPGYWTEQGSRFGWVKGHWGKPGARLEQRPAPPFGGALWVPGDWILVQGSWVWSPGFYEGAQRPPPPRAETPPPSPGAGAVWLQGFWRWDAARHEHEWVAGHWELPPAEGYVWVPEPAGAQGLIIRGHWELRARRAR